MRLEHVGRFGFWVPDAPVAAEAALQAAVPILLEDEYQLRELRRAGHWPQWIVDVGGHCGAFGLVAVDLFPGANLLAVEPFAESAHCYRANLGERACQLHLIEAAAVGPGSADPIELCVAQRTTANWLDGLWEPLPEDACQRQIQVPARRLSSCLAEAGFPRVDLLKLDCEGAEVAVLEDLAETGWLERVRWVRLEWHGQQNLARVACLLAPTHVFAAHCDSPQQPLGFGLAHSRKDAD